MVRLEVWGCAVLAAALSSCVNPFAPAEGEVGGGVWSDQRTVGGLLRNFALAYDWRDSLRYADCLDESFIFHYYDVTTGHSDSWPRSADLKATGGLFRAFDRIDLEWNMVPAEVEAFDLPDSTLRFLVHFSLMLGDQPPVVGFARFAARLSRGGKFRLLEWWDEF